VFPAEMPEDPSPIVPLDADTAERLLSGRLDPDDAPPGYAEVARVLQAAAGPAEEAELADEEIAANQFHTARRRRPEAPGHRASGLRGRTSGLPGQTSGVRGQTSGVQGQTSGVRGQASDVQDQASGVPRQALGVRGRLVVLALAGAVVMGGVGVWTAGGIPRSRELGSPSGGPGAGGSGSGLPASGGYGSGAGGAGSLRPAGPGLGPGAGAAHGTGARPPSIPSAREPATARHGGDVTSGGGGPGHGAKPTRPAKQPKPKPEKPRPEKPEPEKARGPKAENQQGEEHQDRGHQGGER
jgi:hypothetical protein